MWNGICHRPDSFHIANHVVQHTLATMHEFPDRQIFGEDVIIGDKGYGFSHRSAGVR